MATFRRYRSACWSKGTCPISISVTSVEPGMSSSLGDAGPAQVELDQDRALVGVAREADREIAGGGGLAAAHRRRGDGQPGPAVLAHRQQDLGAQDIERGSKRPASAVTIR
jgi:hypothetical protein